MSRRYINAPLYTLLFTFLAVFNYLNPGDEGENVAYWLSQSNVSVAAELYDASEVEPSRKMGRPRNLRPIDEYFAVMCRLRQGLPEEHLALLFKVSVSTVIKSSFYYLG